MRPSEKTAIGKEMWSVLDSRGRRDMPVKVRVEMPTIFYDVTNHCYYAAEVVFADRKSFIVPEKFLFDTREEAIEAQRRWVRAEMRPFERLLKELEEK